MIGRAPIPAPLEERTTCELLALVRSTEGVDHLFDQCVRRAWAEIARRGGV